jgi:ParB-like chromosome segregation protein Spo0J
VATSFKQLIKDGTIKRGDLLRAQHADIRVEPGFNLSMDPDEFERLANELAAFILAGGIIPPLLLRIDDEGNLFIVDGHLRHRALAIAIDRATDLTVIERLSVVSFMPFTGNDADRLDVVFDSRKGRQLTDLERAIGYKRYANMGLNSTEIAERRKVSRPHVESYLLLANAPIAVQKLVQSGKVKVTVAIAAIRKHGEKALDVLTGKRVTVSDVNGKPLPRKVMDEVEASLKWFRNEALDAEQRLAVGQAEVNPAMYADAPVTVTAGALAELMKAAAMVQEARAQQETKSREKANRDAQTDIEDAA